MADAQLTPEMIAKFNQGREAVKVVPILELSIENPAFPGEP